MALFAALSYAITSSGRGGSGIDKEQASIIASQIMQEISRIESSMTRLNIIGSYDQVHFDDGVENTGGTIYQNQTGTSTGHTIGLFNDTTGVSDPFIPEAAFDDYDTVSDLNIQYGSFGIDSDNNGTKDAEYGSADADVVLRLRELNQNVCEALNKQFTGSTDIPVFQVPTGTGGSYSQRYTFFSSSFSSSNTTTILVLPEPPICLSLIHI